MARKLDDVMAALPAKRRAKIEQRTQELATLKDLRQAHLRELAINRIVLDRWKADIEARAAIEKASGKIADGDG